jgi:hypothetical protein
MRRLPFGEAFPDPTGNCYIADDNNNVISVVNEQASTIAVLGTYGPAIAGNFAMAPLTDRTAGIAQRCFSGRRWN